MPGQVAKNGLIGFHDAKKGVSGSQQDWRNDVLPGCAGYVCMCSWNIMSSYQDSIFHVAKAIKVL